MNLRLPRLRSQGNANATALGLAAAIMLVPANLLPILETDTSGSNRLDTIFSGVVQLWRHRLGAIAAIVFAASIVIPVLKLSGLAYLIASTRSGPPRNPVRLTRIYAALDFIGRWSMLDVFLAAFLTGLVQFGEFATVEARSGIVAFASAVILTVLATEAFDPRTLWDSRLERLP
ncbi:MAG TPA: paraquat-inducible protein A [Opitutaceae bacterium]